MIPWMYQGKPFEPTYEHILVNHHYGFVYRITNLTDDRQYIGKKSFLSFRKGKKYQSDWRNYYSSSTELKNDVVRLSLAQFKFDILSIHNTERELSYAETRQMFIDDVLNARFPHGGWKFYNRAIPSTNYYRQG